jgi:hypothetical protein
LSFTALKDLPFPNLPSHLIDEVVRISYSMSAISIFRDTPTASGRFCLRNTSNTLLKWARDNVSDQIKIVWVQTIKDGNFGPHIDGPGKTSGSRRYFNLMYILNTGGEKVLTHFYDPLKADIGDQTVFKYEEVLLKETFEFKANTWNMMNNQEIHSVEGVTGNRVCLSLSFYNPELPKMFENLISAQEV